MSFQLTLTTQLTTTIKILPATRTYMTRSVVNPLIELDDQNCHESFFYEDLNHLMLFRAKFCLCQVKVKVVNTHPKLE